MNRAERRRNMYKQADPDTVDMTMIKIRPIHPSDPRLAGTDACLGWELSNGIVVWLGPDPDRRGKLALGIDNATREEFAFIGQIFLQMLQSVCPVHATGWRYIENPLS